MSGACHGEMAWKADRIGGALEHASEMPVAIARCGAPVHLPSSALVQARRCGRGDIDVGSVLSGFPHDADVPPLGARAGCESLPASRDRSAGFANRVVLGASG